jgi:hypothetical protein
MERNEDWLGERGIDLAAIKTFENANVHVREAARILAQLYDPELRGLLERLGDSKTQRDLIKAGLLRRSGGE